MSKTLVIVESPAKAKTISSFLGKSYEVLASYGHVRDLPEGGDQIPEEFKKQKWARLGVNVESAYEPIYVVTPEKKRQVDVLKKSAKDAERILLATDEDREGESISWHILQVLKPSKKVKVERIVFHEITPEAINAALANPRTVDEHLVKAQETRRILDRLYGYTLSPLLWKKVAPKLSAGRVQSVATRLIVLRERERRDFVTVNYYGIEADLSAKNGQFRAKLQRIDTNNVADGASFDSEGKLTEKGAYWLRGEEAVETSTRLEKAEPWMVSSIETKPGKEYPQPPFMTSTLQQEANRKLGLTARRAMQIAQELYEGVEIGGERVGLITYMRTDSLALAERAVTQAREVIGDLYGKDYVPAKANVYKSKAKNAQEAHEAIRPTELNRRPQDIQRHLTSEQFKLYELIWKRTLASQMKPAEVERTKVEVTVPDASRTLTFAASGKAILFPGFLRVYVEGADDPEAELGDKEKILPTMKQGEILDLVKIESASHDTKPPARYTEATLVRTLEAEGVGRPSTYASIIGTIQDRGYVFKKSNQLIPTFTAFAVTELLENNFHDLVDTKFTAKMEEELDEISEGRLDSVAHLRRFYEGAGDQEGIAKQVDSKAANIPFPAISITDDIVVRIGRNGPFLQRGEGGTGNTASVPEDMPPADLSAEEATRILDSASKGPEAVAVDPASGQCVFHKKGRFGDYFELKLTPEQEAAGAAPKRVTVPPGVNVSDLTDEQVGVLMSFPRTIGKDDSGAEVIVAIGRYGAYLTAGERKANVGEWTLGASLDLPAALKLLEEGGAKKAGARASAEPLKVFGALTDIEGEVKLMSGRFGPYVTNGTVNATLPRSIAPETLTAEKAAELIKAKIAAGPSVKKPFKRGGARSTAKAPAKKTTTAKKKK